MAFLPGQSGNLNGRPPGSVSEKVRLWNQLGSWVAEDGAEKAKRELEKLEGEDFLKYWVVILEFFKPKQSRVEAVVTTRPVIKFLEPLDEAQLIEDGSDRGNSN